MMTRQRERERERERERFCLKAVQVICHWVLETSIKVASDSFTKMHHRRRGEGEGFQSIRTKADCFVRWDAFTDEKG